MADVAIPVPAAKQLLVTRVLEAFRAHKLAFIIAGGVIGVLLASSLGTVALSMQPTFCATCHEIRPAYDQWRSSSHNGVMCLDCHTDPGPAGYVKVNAAGAKNLLTHVVAGGALPARAEVSDASCVRCHPAETRPEYSPRSTLLMAHSKHNMLRCADCHTRMVHTDPTGEAAVAPAAHVVRGCTVCHIPETCPHGDAALACTSCHSGAIPKHTPAIERGVMPRESCQECHLRMGIGSAENCQTCHTSPHGISVLCTKCHTSQTTWTEHTLKHIVPLVGKHAELNCVRCHAAPTTDPIKYVCANCHTPPVDQNHKADAAAKCAMCHSTKAWIPSLPAFFF
jgi:hypothetical protein